MRKILFLFTLSVFSCLIFAQITKIAVEPVKEKVAENIAVYDSTRNYLRADVMLYKGQTLYIKGSKEGDKEKVFYGFYNYIPSDNYSPKDEEVFELRYYNGYQYSASEELKDHYFYIEDVLKNPVDTRDKNIYYLKLRDLSNNRIIYLSYDKIPWKWEPELLIVGYFEKLKQLYIGQTYEFYDPTLVNGVKNDIYLSPDTVKYAGKRYSERNHTIWKCIDISIEDGNNYDLVAVLYNDKLGKAYAKIDEILPENYMNSRLWNCKTNEMNISIWGEETFNLIRQKRIRLGMKRDACLLSWGEPQDIIRETDAKAVTEQWTYDGGVTLYFKNGLLEKVRQQRTDE